MKKHTVDDTEQAVVHVIVKREPDGNKNLILFFPDDASYGKIECYASINDNARDGYTHTSADYGYYRKCKALPNEEMLDPVVRYFLDRYEAGYGKKQSVVFKYVKRLSGYNMRCLRG